MATIAPRAISSRFITNPDDSTQGVKLKVIDEISFIDPRRRGQETRFKLVNDPTAGRKVKVVNVGELTTSTTQDKLLVERVLNFGVVDNRRRGQESRFTLLNASDPLIHLKTHKTKVYATDANGVKDTDVWVEVQRIDEIQVRDPRQRGQDAIYTLSWKDKADPEWDYTDVPEPTKDWDGTTINPPWRLDPFQNIVDASWGGALSLFVMYSGNKVAAIPMSKLYTLLGALTGATGISSATGATSATGPLVPTYQKTLSESSWGQDYDTWQGAHVLAAAQFKFDISGLSGPSAATAATAASSSYVNPIMWPFRIDAVAPPTGPSGSTGYKLSVNGDGYILTKAGKHEEQINIIRAPISKPPIVQIANDHSKIYTNNCFVNIGPTGSFGSTDDIPGATGTEAPVWVDGSGVYHYAAYLDIAGPATNAVLARSAIRTNLSFAGLDYGNLVWEDAQSSWQEQQSTSINNYTIGLGRSWQEASPAMGVSFVGTLNPYNLQKKMITPEWDLIVENYVNVSKIKAITGGTDLSQSAPVVVYSATGGSDVISVDAATFAGFITAQTNIDADHSPGIDVTQSASFLDVSVTNSFNTRTPQNKLWLISYFNFPLALGATAGKAYIEKEYWYNGSDSSTAVCKVFTPYGELDSHPYSFGTYKFPGFSPWLHLSNGRVFLQGFVNDDRRYVFVNGKEIGNYLRQGLGITDSKDIQMMLLDVPTSWIQKLT